MEDQPGCLGTRAQAWRVAQLKCQRAVDYTDFRIIDVRIGLSLTSTPPSASRRISARRVADVKVFAYDGVEVRKCTLKDISLDGAYIKTKNFALPNGTDLEVVLKIRRGGKPRHCRLPAKVVRAERDGMAVMFGELDEERCNILLDIVKPPEQSQ